METKAFHIGDVLSITTGRLVSNRHIDGVYDILNFMTGSSLMTHRLPEAVDVCRPILFEQFPELKSQEMEDAVAVLIARLETHNTKKPETIIRIWLAGVVNGRYGIKFNEWYDVAPIGA